MSTRRKLNTMDGEIMPIKYILLAGIVLSISACKANTETPNTPKTPATHSDTHSHGPDTAKPTKPPRASMDDVEDEFDIKNFSKANAKFVGLVEAEEMASAELRIRAYFTPEESTEGKTTYSYEKTYESNGLTRVVATATGLMDDSVQAEQLVAYFKPVSPERAELSHYGMRFKCWRGDTPNVWTANLCP